MALYGMNGCKKADELPKHNLPEPIEITTGRIYYIDMEGNSLYDLFMIESLQGNINRVSPLIWVLKTPIVEYDGSGRMVDRAFWLNTITDIAKTEFHDPFLMVRDFSGKINGCVIYDNNLFGNYKSGARYPQPNENLVAKLNATAMLCAKFNAIALTKEQHQTLIDKYSINLPILSNTTTSDFDNWIACYRYIYSTIDQDLNREMMANNSHYCLGMFDFLIKNKMFIINLKGSPSVLEQNLTDNIFNRCSSPAPVYGIWNLTGGEPNEDSFQKYLNAKGKYCIANFEAFNLSFTSGMPKFEPEQSETNRMLKYDPSKKYICFTETDGDNYEFIQQIFPLKFNITERENYPIGWEIPSTLCELDPVAAKWFYSNRGQNCFVNPVTGAGYYKYILPDQYLTEYFEHTDQLMKLSRFRIIRTMGYSFNDGIPLTEIPEVEGVFCGYGGNDSSRPTISQHSQTHKIHNGKPIFINYSYLDINDILSYSIQSPAFLSVACVYTSPADLIKTIKSLPSDWVVVSPAEMVDIYKQFAK